MTEKILDLLLNSKLDSSGLSITENDTRKIAEAINEFRGANLHVFRINRDEKNKSPIAYYNNSKKEIVFFINRMRNSVARILKSKNAQRYLTKLNKNEYELFVKSLSFIILLHEFDHVVQHRIMDKKEIDNPDYLLLEFSHENFIDENNDEFSKLIHDKIGNPLTRNGMDTGDMFFAQMLREYHDLIPYERMANFNAYDQLIKALNLDEKNCSNLISILKVLYLKPLLSVYTSAANLKVTNNYGGNHSPSIYYIANVSGIHYFGKTFEERLFALYRDYPLVYRFYTGIRIEREESRIYKDEIRIAESNLKK